MSAARGTLSLYDGRERLGGIVARKNGFDATNAKGKGLGNFASVKIACAAISAARRTAAKPGECLQQLQTSPRRRVRHG
jgi:hypothetical protein